MIINAKLIARDANPAEYHQQQGERGTPEFVMSSGALREFAACPSRWRAGYVSPDSKAREWGSILDCLLTSPKRFDALYAIEPDEYTNDDGETKKWNNNAAVCKAWHRDQCASGKEIADKHTVKQSRAAIVRLRQDEAIAAWLDSSDTQVWLTAEWHDKSTGLVIPLKVLLDFVPRLGTEFANCLGDFKTTRNAGTMPWQRWCYTAGYHVQAALYADTYIAAHPDEDRNTWCFIVQENYPPYEPGKRMLSQGFLTLGRASYKAMLENYCQCVQSQRFPGYDDTDESIQGWSLVEAEPWMAERAAFAPRYQFAAEPAPETAPETDDELTYLQ